MKVKNWTEDDLGVLFILEITSNYSHFYQFIVKYGSVVCIMIGRLYLGLETSKTNKKLFQNQW